MASIINTSQAVTGSSDTWPLLHVSFIQHLCFLVNPPLSPPATWGRRAGVPSRGDPLPCRKSHLKLDCCELPPLAFLHRPLPCALLEGTGGGPGLEQGEERVEETVVGWDRVRERGGPAPGPGWQMTPACRLKVTVGFPVGGELEEVWRWRVIRWE